MLIAVLFPKCFPPDPVAKLKHGHFYSGLCKWLKAMVAYLKVSAHEKTYSNYQRTAREAEKEEVMEPSQNQTANKPSKPKATSFFPLQNLKGTQPTEIPVVRQYMWKKRVLKKRWALKVNTWMASMA